MSICKKLDMRSPYTAGTVGQLKGPGRGPNSGTKANRKTTNPKTARKGY